MILLCLDSKIKALESFCYVLIVLGFIPHFSSETPLYKSERACEGC